MIGLWVTIPSSGNAQVLDREWERIQSHNPWLYQLDNRPWKTWIWHSVISVGAGRAIAVLTPLNAKQGMRLMVGAYLVREIYNYFDGANDHVDQVMDVLMPAMTVELIIRW